MRQMLIETKCIPLLVDGNRSTSFLMSQEMKFATTLTRKSDTNLK